MTLGHGNPQSVAAGDAKASVLGRRVLIIEDEFAVSMLLEDMLQDMGCVVAETASRLPDATAKAETIDYDVAILDVNLDGKNTFDLARTMATRGRRFVFATGYGRSILPADLANAPILAKPYSFEDLESVVTQALKPN